MTEKITIKNISKFKLPIDGTTKHIDPQKIMKDISLTPRLQYMIKNKFFEVIKENEIERPKILKESKETNFPKISQEYPVKQKKKRKKNKYFN